MAIKKAYSPRDVAQLKINELGFTGDWEMAFGRPSVSDTWFVCGQSASGKSSFVMRLAKVLCDFGSVLYLSLEEGVGKSFAERMEREHMKEVQGRFRVITDGDIEALRLRLHKAKSPRFIIVDSFQFSGWDYAQTKSLVEEFSHKGFIFVSQEDKGRPIGKAAVRLRYLAGVKIRTMGFRAYCQGRFVGDSEAYYIIWKEGEVKVWNL